MLYSYLKSFSQIAVHGIKEHKIRINKNTRIKVFQQNIAHEIQKIALCGDDICISLKGHIDIKKECYVLIEGYLLNVNYSPLFKTDEFNLLYAYDGPLGYIYNKEYTEFYVWSPIAEKINLLLYKNFDPTIEEKPEVFEMQSLQKGVYYIKIDGDLDGLFYNYEAHVYGKRNVVVDPYAYAVGVNGLREF